MNDVFDWVNTAAYFLLLAVSIFVIWREKRRNPTGKGTYLERLKSEQTSYLEHLFPHIGRARQINRQIRRGKIF